jgi:hypothetical protein
VEPVRERQREEDREKYQEEMHKQRTYLRSKEYQRMCGKLSCEWLRIARQFFVPTYQHILIEIEEKQKQKKTEALMRRESDKIKKMN